VSYQDFDTRTRTDKIGLLVAVGSKHAAPCVAMQVRALKSAFSVAVIESPVADGVESRSTWLERAYRWFDRKLFGPGAGAETECSPVKRSNAGESGLAGHVISLLSATSKNLPLALENHAKAGVVSITYDGLAAPYLEEAVRRQLGHAGGMVETTVLLDEGGRQLVLYRGFCALDHRSLSRSVSWVASKLPDMLRGALARLDAGAPWPPEQLPAQAPPAPLPTSRMLQRLVSNVLKKLWWRDQWFVQIHSALAGGGPGATGPLVALIEPPTDSFWADPFLIQRNGRWWLFFEELAFSSRKAHLSVVELAASGHVKGEVRRVLSEPWHLSYPFLWEDGGRLYMVPESSANETLDLYECIDFPHAWRKVVTLFDSVRYADATVVQYDGQLWMFAASSPPGGSLYDELHIHWAPRIEGPWQAHPLNPVKIDARSSRPAGSMWVEQGTLFRPTQDCSSVYGGAVTIQRVTRLNEKEFSEVDIGRVPAPEGASGLPFHTLNSAGNWTVVDVLRQIPRLRLRKSQSI
jgi:hypothetical protein